MKLGLRCSKTTNAHGEVRYRRDGVLHRINGPALDCPNGYQVWYKFGNEHRDDGPARIRANGDVEYFLDGVEFDNIELYNAELKRRKAIRGE